MEEEAHEIHNAALGRVPSSLPAPTLGAFKNLVDINFICAMGPPGGGRNAITPRLTRHFNYLSFAEMDEVSKKRIFSTILGSWVGEYWVGAGEAMGKGRSPGQLSYAKDSWAAAGKSEVAHLSPGFTPYSSMLPLANS